MSRWTRMGSAALLLATLAVVMTRPAPAQDQKPAAQPNDFAGKLLIVYTGNDGQGATLENPRMESLAGQQFLVGRFFDDGSREWTRGATVWTPMSAISYVLEFDSPDQYRQRMNEAGGGVQPGGGL